MQAALLPLDRLPGSSHLLAIVHNRHKLGELVARPGSSCWCTSCTNSIKLSNGFVACFNFQLADLPSVWNESDFLSLTWGPSIVPHEVVPCEIVSYEENSAWKIFFAHLFFSLMRNELCGEL